MFNKTFLVNRIANNLLSNSFEVFLSSGCFDIAAKREQIMLIKGLINVDGLGEEQARSLHAASHFLSAYPLIVSMKTSRELLNDDIVYSRFQLPVVTPSMFTNIIEDEEISVIQSAKGRHTVSVNASAIREKRKEMGFTIEELAKLVGISKKALYEIENYRVNPSVETVEKIERILNEKVKMSFELKKTEPIYLKPIDSFQNRVSKELYRIGIDNSPVYSAPFEIAGREDFSLITSLSTNAEKMRREAKAVKQLSSITSSQAVFIARKSRDNIVDGVPVLLEEDLSDIKNAKELSKIIKEKV